MVQPIAGTSVLATQDGEFYDLGLVKAPNGDYFLRATLRIYFHFVFENCTDPSFAEGYAWSISEKEAYMKDWRSSVLKVWDRYTLKLLKHGRKVILDLYLEVQEAPGEWDLWGNWVLTIARSVFGGKFHWTASVKKIGPDKFCRSWVDARKLTASFDNLDTTPVFKSGKQKQRGAIHEFGHMLRAHDEYKRTGSDFSSVMHSGESLRPHHFDHLRPWLEQSLKEAKIE